MRSSKPYCIPLSFQHVIFSFSKAWMALKRVHRTQVFPTCSKEISKNSFTKVWLVPRPKDINNWFNLQGFSKKKIKLSYTFELQVSVFIYRMKMVNVLNNWSSQKQQDRNSGKDQRDSTGSVVILNRPCLFPRNTKHGLVHSLPYSELHSLGILDFVNIPLRSWRADNSLKFLFENERALTENICFSRPIAINICNITPKEEWRV